MDTEQREAVLTNALISSFKVYNGFEPCTADQAHHLVDGLKDIAALTSGEANRLKDKLHCRLNSGKPDDLATTIDRNITKTLTKHGVACERVLADFQERLERIEAALVTLMK